MKKNVSLTAFLSRGASIAWRERKIGLLLFSIQFVMSLFLVLPLHSKWSALLGHSRMGDEVLNGFGANFLAEFTVRHSNLISAEVLWTLLFAGATLVLNIFFNGGMIACFAGSKQGGFPFFFEKSSRFFARLLRLFLLSLPLLIAALIVQSLLGMALQPLAGGMEPWQAVFVAVQFTVLAVLFFFINMVFDYAKIITVNKNRRDMFKTAIRAFRFVFRNRRKTFSLYYGIGAAGLALSLMFVWTGRRIDFPTGFGLLFLSLWFQVLAMARIAVRMEFYASQSVLYRSLSAQRMRVKLREKMSELMPISRSR